MKTIVLIPTYNEKDNIKRLIEAILHYPVEILVVDDNSPDKTAEIVKAISKNHKQVHLLSRKGKRGRGLAGKAGFKKALEMKADYVIEMDADFSHDPRDIPQFIEKSKDSDVLLGSRFVKEGKQKGRGIFRRIITRFANFYTRKLLGLSVKDCNSGFRGFKPEVLRKIGIENIKARGPDIVQEILYKAHQKRFKIKEIPITFVDRKLGKSKLTLKDLFKGYIMVTRLKIVNIFKSA